MMGTSKHTQVQTRRRIRRVYKIYALKKKIMMPRKDITTIHIYGYKQPNSSSDKKKDKRLSS